MFTRIFNGTLLSGPAASLALATIAVVALAMAPVQAQPCGAPAATDFKKEKLIDNNVLAEPIELSVAKNGMVFVVQRGGDITLYNPATAKITTAIHLDCYLYAGQMDVGGPLGVAVAPDFPTDPWVYLYYNPKATFTGSANNTSGKLTYRLSRFHFNGATLDANSEQTLFDVKAIWETHNGGSLKFGKNGDLYLSVGDNHAAGCSNQYSPMDERSGNSWCDDQGTTANTNELRGKILRIHPEATQQANGKYYSIPAGNLKEKYASLWATSELAAKVLPEIYTMGHRNPYRIFPDPVTGKLFIAENGPASSVDADRGPAGADQWKVTDEAAYLGYPYFLKDNQPYCHWDYAQGKCVAITGQTSMKYDPAKPLNYSPNNTGVNILPPAKPAALWEHDGANPDPVKGLKACGPGAGPVYHFDPALNVKTKFPPDLDGKWIIFPIFAADWQPKLVDPPSNFAPITAATTPPWGNLGFSQGLQDMEFGSGDGALYVLDYGTGTYTANGNAALYKISYTGCLPPVGVAAQGHAGRGFLAMPGNGSLAAPEGARRATLYDMAGKQVWETALPYGESRVNVPEALRSGMLRVRWN